MSLNNPDLTSITSNIFEARRDCVDAAIPQVALAAASHCTQSLHHIHCPISYCLVSQCKGCAKPTSRSSLSMRQRKLGVSCPVLRNTPLGDSLSIYRWFCVFCMIGYMLFLWCASQEMWLLPIKVNNTTNSELVGMRVVGSHCEWILEQESQWRH